MLSRWDGFNATFEPANIPHWEREGMGWPESCTLISPVIGLDNQEYGGTRRQQKLSIKGLGKSVGFPTEEGVTADVIVVTSWRELYAKGMQGEVTGKIVVYSVPWRGYDITASYRSRGAAMAAYFGGVAALSRSAASFSIDSPHTGSGGYMQDYCLRSPRGCDCGPACWTNVTADSAFGQELGMAEGSVITMKQVELPHIPHAGLSVEDSDMLGRMAERGEHIRIHLSMGGKNFPADENGRNTLLEIRGSEFPDEVVLVSGHIDSWDVGQGAMDDAGPAFVAQQAVALIKHLGLKPKRTLRWVGWTTEETQNRLYDEMTFHSGGTSGGGAYYAAHSPQATGENHSLVLELDNGIWNTQGIRLAACAETASIMTHTAQTYLKVRQPRIAESNEYNISVTPCVSV